MKLLVRVAFSLARFIRKRAPRRIAVVLLVLYGIVSMMLPVGDSLSMTAAEAASASHRYGLLSFEINNFPAKWTHRVYTALPWTHTSTADRITELDRYLEIVPLIRDAQYRVLQESSRGVVDTAALGGRQRTLDNLLRERNRLRDGVEEYLESAISTQVRQQGLGSKGSFLWPPVDFRIDNPPSLLVVSPRDRIERSETILIDPNISAADMERIENKLLAENNLSAVILRTGGLGSYPNVIPSDRDLLSLLEVASHEWVHAYLIFFPLGRSFFNGGDMVTINETLANIVGDEIGGETWATLTGNPAPVRQPPPAVDSASPEPDTGEFSYFQFMRQTRLRTDELLAEGDVSGAETWMEQRRLELQDHGYIIRKINQAFFAFNGSYGDSPSSTSPIASQMWQLRAQEGSAGNLLKAIRGISTYSDFEALLVEYGITSEK
jgi:hypothetical protein